MNDGGPPAPMTGRLSRPPAAILHEHVLAPQFRFEARHLLRWYLLVEQVLLAEYARMGQVSESEAAAIADVLNAVTADDLVADPDANLSDICLAVERYVLGRLPRVPAAWHVDRSRNDIQACAQLLYARDEVLEIADALLAVVRIAHRRAGEAVDLPMPGYTHLQAAQVISPGFFLSALVEHGLRTLRRLLATYDEVNLSPLGAGAMSGQELPWDRERMAALVGCSAAQRHALTAVASRAWAVEIAGELSHFGVGLSRFVTDLMTWASTPCGFLELPDELAGISASMPQKKNYPVLERIRGRTAHLSSLHHDLVSGQRNTPYSNMVEVSKEAGAHLGDLFQATRSVLVLLDTVLENVTWRPAAMRAACDQEYLGGFTLANQLTLTAGIPWRTAQVIVGQYISAALLRGTSPADADPDLLAGLARQAGYLIDRPADLVASVSDTDAQLTVKCSDGSAAPAAVRTLLAQQAADLDGLATRWSRHRSDVAAACARTGSLFRRDHGEPVGSVARGKGAPV